MVAVTKKSAPANTTSSTAKVSPKKPTVSVKPNQASANTTSAQSTISAQNTIATKSPATVVQKTAIVKPAKPAKIEKVKLPKLKMERDSFTMPKNEYAHFFVLKDRLIKLNQPAKKSELIRAGLMLLSGLTDAQLKAAMIKVPEIKTGRPKK